MLYPSKLHRQLPGTGVHLERESLNKSNLKKKKKSCFAMRKDQNLLELSLRFSSDSPLYDSPGKASFDQYLEDKPRLFRATFPGTSQRINEEEWRVEMPQIQLLFVKILPVIHMKSVCKTNGKDYLVGVPHHITKVLEIETTNWEIHGVHGENRPTSIKLECKGAIYSEKRGIRSRLKFQMLLNLSFVTSKALSFVPKDVLQSLAETVLKAVIEDLKRQAINRLVEDYSNFRNEKK